MRQNDILTIIYIIAGESTMNITILGIDLSKEVFQLHGVDKLGKAILKRTIRRSKLLEFMVNFPRCLVVMEACGSANFWSRQFKELGHEVKLISPQFVKPFVKGNKNDYQDAEAIVEAASRPSMRYVSPKTIAQQDMQSLLRMRESAIQMRTKISNQLRGLLAEYGVVMPRGLSRLRSFLSNLIDSDNADDLTIDFKQLLAMQYTMLLNLDDQINEFDKKVEWVASEREDCQRVKQVPGIGAITAVALAATIGSPNDFKNGRHFAAFLGLVPRQHSSGGKERLLGISKRGDSYLRQLLIHGARSVLNRVDKKDDTRSHYLKNLKSRIGMNRTAVALANKNARTVLAMLLKNEDFKSYHTDALTA